MANTRYEDDNNSQVLQIVDLQVWILKESEK